VFNIHYVVPADISGLTITKGSVGGIEYGGGISSAGGTLTIDRVILAGNSAYAGGGIYSSGILTVTDSTFSGNSSSYGGGLYIGGGIVPRLGTLIDASGFRESFESKGRFRDYVRDIPTYVIQTDASAALLGAARALDP
jgi:predicted outer membrane repeat protein